MANHIQIRKNMIKGRASLRRHYVILTTSELKTKTVEFYTMSQSTNLLIYLMKNSNYSKVLDPYLKTKMMNLYFMIMKMIEKFIHKVLIQQLRLIDRNNNYQIYLIGFKKVS